jgi:hypothetical protein
MLVDEKRARRAYLSAVKGVAEARPAATNFLGLAALKNCRRRRALL